MADQYKTGNQQEGNKMNMHQTAELEKINPGKHTHHESGADIFDLIKREGLRQNECIELIASENFVSDNVLKAQGSLLTNKYAEGYPGRRYYGGCQVVDLIEAKAIQAAKELFKCNYANVQPHSGSQANGAVFLALLSPGDKILGLNLNAGGHLTHGSPVNMSGRWFTALSYGVDATTHRIDMDEVRSLALEHKPKLIIAGGSAYPRAIDFAGFREIADGIGAYLMVDMAHIAGLVAAGVHDSPLPYAHIVSSTTHKTLRGPRGGLLLCNDAAIAKKIDSAIFPGMQGGPLMHVIAAKAVAFEEALASSFSAYGKAVVDNAAVFASALSKLNFGLVSGGTDNHLLLIDLRARNITGVDFEAALGRAGITCNKNSVPGDTQKPTVTSGVRFGSAATTTRGFEGVDYVELAQLIADVAENLSNHGSAPDEVFRKRAAHIITKFPLANSAFN
jgi:glycine hydroxymethyltransferase